MVSRWVVENACIEATSAGERAVVASLGAL